MALSDSGIKAAKPAARQFKLADERGLFLLVTPSGGKLWRLKYRFSGKEQLLSVGRYPDVSLKDARERRDDARKVLASGKNPAAERKRSAVAAAISAANTFKAVAEEVIDKGRQEGNATATVEKAEWFLELLDPALGSRPIAEIEAFEVLAVIKKIEASGRHETARRLLSFTGRVFRYAVATTRARSNPAADLKGSLVGRRVKHYSAIIDPVQLGALLRSIDGFQGQATTRLALRLTPHVFVRPGELRHAEWSEFDLAMAIWRLPPDKMKMAREHVVPLSSQAIGILKEAALLTGGGRYVFPSVRSLSRPMSENTVNAALRRLGYGTDEMTAHGFRSSASTLLNQSGRWSSDAIERALAHQDDDNVRAAYHRGTHWEERVRMAQWWGDYLDGLRAGGTVVALDNDRRLA